MRVWDYWHIRHDCDDTRRNRATRWNGCTRENVDIYQNNVSSWVNLDVRTGTEKTQNNILKIEIRRTDDCFFIISWILALESRDRKNTRQGCNTYHRNHIKRFRVKEGSCIVHTYRRLDSKKKKKKRQTV